VSDTRTKSRFLETEAMSRLSHLRFETRHVMEGLYSGRRRSHHKGGAAEFLEHRQYTPGDDLRRLDWKVLGRTGRPYVRVYEDETNLAATVVLDVSRSMLFGARSLTDTAGSKLDYARYVGAALSHIILRDRDRVGLALASAGLDRFVPMSSAPNQMDAVLAGLEDVTPGPQTSLADALGALFSMLGRRGMLIVVSDFLEEDLEALFAALRLFRHQHFGILLLHVVHPQEERLPSGTAFRFEGLEGEGLCDCSPRDIADLYERRFRKFLSGLRDLATATGCAYQRFSTAVPYITNLKTLLVERQG